MNGTGGDRSWTTVLCAGIAVLLLLYLASIGPYWNISPDSATYVDWARSVLAGDGFGDRPFHPPVTSLAFAVALAIEPDGYVFLNALNTLMLLAGLGVAGLVLRRQASRTVALLCVLIALAYRETWHESTQLLSEPAYVLVSMLALLFLEDSPAGHRSPRLSRFRTVLGAVMVVAAVMTRTIGVTLALAVLVVEGIAVVRRRRPRLTPVVGALAAILALVLWEVYTIGTGAPGKFQMFLLRDAWSPVSGVQSPMELVTRIWSNAPRVADAGRALLNKASTGVGWFDIVLGGLAAMTFLTGLVHALRERSDLTTVYLALYTAVVAAHILEGGYDPYRHLVPVMPLVALHAIRGMEAGSRRVTRAVPRAAAQIAGVTFVTVYAGLGMVVAARGARAEHRSPFGDYPIKRASNPDLQRAAMRLREIAGPGDRYGGGQVDMLDVITERRGRSIPADARRSPESLAAWVRASAVRFLVVDHRARGSDTLRAALDGDTLSFQPLLKLRDASLFVVRQSLP